jgi:hypothetical protein
VKGGTKIRYGYLRRILTNSLFSNREAIGEAKYTINIESNPTPGMHFMFRSKADMGRASITCRWIRSNTSIDFTLTRRDSFLSKIVLSSSYDGHTKDIRKSTLGLNLVHVRS